MNKGEQMANQLAGASAPANSQQKIAPAAIAAIISAVGGLASAGVSSWSARRANQRNVDLMHEQNNWNLEQWMRENAYNLPQAQRARLIAAGLNPALIYGQGGIMNEAANSQPAADAPTMRPELNTDPMTASHIALNQAQAESIRDANKRENEKQPLNLQQLEEDIKQTHEKTNEILQNILNLKFDEQLKSMRYLRESLDYQFASTTFNDAVEQFKTTLNNLKLVGQREQFDLNRALQYLSYEVVGWDLSNKRQRALLNIDLQSYRQTEELFDSIKTKAFWEGQNSYMDWRLKGKEEGIMTADRSLKELAFWIDARENKVAYGLYQDSLNGHNVNSNFFGKWFIQFSDYWNHGINLPIRFGFNMR